MIINYKKLSRKFKPKGKVKVLLIGEAPPPSGKSYFYKVPSKYNPIGTIDYDSSLPATIFNHFFGKRPNNELMYLYFLMKLQENGVFLIDIYEFPVRIRENGGLNKDNLEIIFSDNNLANLRIRINKLIDNNTRIIFLLARNYQISYKRRLKSCCMNAEYIPWKDFRMNVENKILE